MPPRSLARCAHAACALREKRERGRRPVCALALVEMQAPRRLMIGVAGALRFEQRRRLGSTMSTLVRMRRSSLRACNRPFAREINERRLTARHGYAPRQARETLRQATRAEFRTSGLQGSALASFTIERRSSGCR
jgi:hypothetical protein